MTHLEHNQQPPHIEVSQEGNFIVIEWSDSDLNLSQIIANTIDDDDWFIRRNVEKEKFLKAFIGEKGGVFTLWISIDNHRGHHSLYTSLPKKKINNIKVAGDILKNESNFVVSGGTIYEKKYLDRQAALDWINSNLPNWI